MKIIEKGRVKRSYQL